MKRFKEVAGLETMDMVRAAYDRYSENKHKRKDVAAFDERLEENLAKVLQAVIDGSFFPSGYTPKVIFEKKRRTLAKAPVIDHVMEAAHVYPYEQRIYDRIAWQAPAVRPGLGNHAFFRFLRNDLYRSSQQEVYYHIQMDAHHFFPRMDHEILKEKLARFIKPGKLREFFHRVIDSYQQGAPLGIKLAQLYGMIYLADFDRMAMRCFGIRDDPEKLAYWTSLYISERIATAGGGDAGEVGRGSQYLARLFQSYLDEGLRHYYRFVDNIIILHRDKCFLRIMRDITLMTLERDYHVTANKDYNVRPTWMGIRVCGYVFYHERTLMNRMNKNKLAKRIRTLQKKGLEEEDIRVKLSSNIGFVKHANTLNLFRKLGMEKSLGKIIRNRRSKPPFEGMTIAQKVRFSSLVKCEDVLNGGGGGS